MKKVEFVNLFRDSKVYRHSWVPRLVLDIYIPNSDKKKTRSRNIIWFNPPFSETVKTKVAEKFLSLIDKHFGKTELRKYLNRSTITVSYSCMTNKLKQFFLDIIRNF